MAKIQNKTPKQQARDIRVKGLALAGLMGLSSFGLTSSIISCKQSTGPVIPPEEEPKKEKPKEDKVITKTFNIFDTTIPVSGKESLFTTNVMDKLTQAFALFSDADFYGDVSKISQNKIKLVLNNGGEIILEKDVDYKYVNAVGTKLYMDVINTIEDPAVSVVKTHAFINHTLVGMGNKLLSYDNSKNTIRLSMGKIVSYRQA